MTLVLRVPLAGGPLTSATYCQSRIRNKPIQVRDLPGHPVLEFAVKYLFLEVLVVLPAAAAHDGAQVEVCEAPELQRGHRVVGQLLVRVARLQRLTVVVDGVGAGV